MMFYTGMLLLLGHVAWASSSSQLRIEEKPQDKVLEAFDKLTLRCIITGGDVKFLWTYQNAQTKTLESLTDNQMAVIKTKDHTSTLTINPVTTVDSGSYKCCAHLINSDENDAACASAKVTVNFGSSNSGSSDSVGTVPTDPSPGFDLCHPYPEQSQGICKQWLGGSIVHADSSAKINDIEKQIQRILEMMSDDSQLSEQCGKYAPRAFCHYLLPTCLENGNSQKRLCRSDCEMLKYSKCAQEFRNIKNGRDDTLKMMANQFQCDHLPDINSDKICTGIDLPPVLDKQHICYSSTGIGYRGGENVTKSGSKCVKWEDANQKPFTSENFPELSGGHFFCRNPVSTKYPEAEMSRPWCYTRDPKNKSKFVQEECQVPLCEPDNLFTNEILMVLLPSIAISLVLALIAVTYCVCRRRSPKGGKGTEFGAGSADQPVDSTNEGLLSPSQETTYMNASIGQFGQNYKKLKLPELSFGSIVCRKELGEAYYGVVYLADVLPNLLYSPNHPCAAKSLNENTNTQQIHQFWREMEMLSELRHDRIANLRAVVIQPQLRAMIFEYTDLGDLKNYLLARNPNSDMPSHAGPLTLEQQIDICHQICEGMEYLSSGDRPYVHRDLAARNILIDSNLQIKISNIGIARMETKNDYFNPQTSNEGNEPAQTLIPVRWMSPESLLEANYTMASDVWSYAVCCWEVFSMGTQPFCGYSNEEVMELVIHRKQVLPCPETCPLQIYNLLINCWSYVAYSRPAFTRIGVVLDQFRKSVPRKQYPAASTVSFNSNQLYRQRSQVQQQQQQQVAPPSSTDNSTVGAPSFYPLSGTPQSIGAPPSGHILLQQRDHQAPPASPVSHSNYRYPTGTRSTTGSSAESSAIGNGLAVPEELLRPLIPNSSRGNHESSSRDPGFQNHNMYVQEPKMYNRNYSQQR